ncbi:MAG: hydrogenase expression/formation protein HypE [Firmicutes bacterium]|nr:hydrogenase expression/formation protein HypE [Bacillota bacterium]
MKREEVILLAHGDGGALTRELIENVFLKHFQSGELRALGDAALFPVQEGRLAFTTDSFVVDPVFFPGGDIGKLAVCGTVNDLAVSGARPLYLAASFIIEEGFSLSSLEILASSMSAACRAAGVKIAAGDTKVVERGHADKIFITTTGVGRVPDGLDLGYHRLCPGDRVILNGCVGSHGLAVLTARENLGLAGQIESDCAPLNHLVEKLLDRFEGIKIMRDLTRGGLATSLKEIAVAAGVDFQVEEGHVPVAPRVRGAAEMLGLDPLYLANEGKFVAVIEAAQADAAVELMRSDPFGREARAIGEVLAGTGNVYLKTMTGGTRLLGFLTGAPLPRIC